MKISQKWHPECRLLYIVFVPQRGGQETEMQIQ